MGMERFQLLDGGLRVCLRPQQHEDHGFRRLRQVVNRFFRVRNVAIVSPGIRLIGLVGLTEPGAADHSIAAKAPPGAFLTAVNATVSVKEEDLDDSSSLMPATAQDRLGSLLVNLRRWRLALGLQVVAHQIFLRRGQAVLPDSRAHVFPITYRF